MTLFPLLTATLEQVAAYGRYFAEKRDGQVLAAGFLFLLVCLVPALALDLLALPLRFYDAFLRRTPSRSASAGASAR